MPVQKSIPKIALILIMLLVSQSVLLAQNFSIIYHFTGKDTLNRKSRIHLTSSFEGRDTALAYIRTLPDMLLAQGFSAASVDSVAVDSAGAKVYLFLGKTYYWQINTDSISPDVLDIIKIKRSQLDKRQFLYPDLKHFENATLDRLADQGFPFATIHTIGSKVDSNSIQLKWKIDKGVQYHIDSIRVFGNVRVKNLYLQHYLRIFDGDRYSKSRLDEIDRLLAALPFLEQDHPWDLMMLGTGATLNLYLKNKRSSEINALIGFLPGNSITGKTKITADVRLNLKNALGGGENILLNWQQLQAQSPRLELGLNLPYILNSPYGIDASFGMLKQDSSWLILNGKFGIEYVKNAHQSFQVFYQLKNTYLLQGGMDTNRIIQYRQLPQYMDVRSGSGGLLFRFDNLDYKFNPRSGSELQATATAGIRKVSVNDEITQLKDPNDPDFDFATLYDTIQKKSYVTTISVAASRYFEVGKRSTIKLAVNSGWLQSPQVFQNELFRLGGYKLLRGFDEQSIYADRYGVLTGEYRFLTGRNSYLFGFTDWGLTHTTYSTNKFSNSFVSGGIGLELETKVGLLNVSYAIGKRNDIKFDIKNASKIHFGYINYF